ncbi:chymotrypsin-2 [Drosophila hydei]|uniref:Chymotrypsin-2 n=1 Tax=Drosophila hydei TaxID=7224 RepID=A0A6J1LA26_DROHY|nr:chymotrypsin-2 [Drosophila hydei]
MASVSRSAWLFSLYLCLCLCLGAEGLRQRGQQLLPGEAAEGTHLRSNPKPIQGRIAGGQQAELGAWPWIVSLQNQFGFPFCSGVIIDDLWILTAASCVAGLRARNLIALAGTVSSWNNSAAGYYVDQIHIHCNFDKPLYHNDIALLHLSGAIEYNAEVAKVTLSEIDELQQGEPLSFAGWGTDSVDGSNSQYLLQSQGDYLPVTECRKVLQNDDDVDLGHVCVQMEAGKGVCHGDAGGPLINAQQQLVGIGNWGVPCGRGYPDVYSRVAFYNDWIRTITTGCGQTEA